MGRRGHRRAFFQPDSLGSVEGWRELTKAKADSARILGKGWGSVLSSTNKEGQTMRRMDDVVNVSQIWLIGHVERIAESLINQEIFSN